MTTINHVEVLQQVIAKYEKKHGVPGLEKADANPEPERLNDYRSAIAELEEMEKHYADCQ